MAGTPTPPTPSPETPAEPLNPHLDLVARMEGALRLLYPEEMTPTAQRVIRSIIDKSKAGEHTMTENPQSVEDVPIGHSPLTPGDHPCMVCGTKRSYDALSVAMRPLEGAEEAYPGTRVNVAFCTDNPECVAVATADGPWKSDAPLSEPQPDEDPAP